MQTADKALSRRARRVYGVYREYSDSREPKQTLYFCVAVRAGGSLIPPFCLDEKINVRINYYVDRTKGLIGCQASIGGESYRAPLFLANGYGSLCIRRTELQYNPNAPKELSPHPFSLRGRELLWGCTHVILNAWPYSRMIMDPYTFTVPGQNTSGFH